jgi:CRISPR-associated protein Cas2
MRTRRMYLIVVYDICETEENYKKKRKNRTRLYKKLKDFGAPVQYSVFEFNVSPEQKNKLMKIISRYIEDGDRVSIYKLCEGCRKSIERLWTEPIKKPIGDNISSIEV